MTPRPQSHAGDEGSTPARDPGRSLRASLTGRGGGPRPAARPPAWVGAAGEGPLLPPRPLTCCRERWVIVVAFVIRIS